MGHLKNFWIFDISNLHVLVQSAGESCTVSHGIESRAVARADGHSKDRHRPQSITIQRCSADIGWSQRGSGAAHCHTNPVTGLCWTGGGLRAHCKVWEIGHGCCRLDGCHCCGGPVLTVTCSCKWDNNFRPLNSFHEATSSTHFHRTEITCPDCIASLIYSHLGANMQWDFWLLACGCLGCCYHSCRLGAGRYSAGAHSEGFV